MVSARERLAGELVEAERQSFGSAPVVDEDQRGAVLLDQLQQLGVHRGPDRLARRLLAGERVQLQIHLLGLDHRLDRHVDLQIQRLADPGVHDRGLAARPDHEPPDLLERVLRRGQPDALDVAAGLFHEPLERQRQVRAALGLRDRVDLVQDHGLRALEDRARLAREHQVQRLRRRDQDVRRVLDHVPPLLLRRVTGPDRDVQVGADAASAAPGGSSRRRSSGLSAATRRRAASARGWACATKRSRPYRKAASVLPEPVGAEIRTWSPVAIAGQACACASVGLAKARLNHSRTWGVN